MVDPPSLPRHLSDMPTVVGIGSGLWLLGAVVLLVAWSVVGRPLDVWFVTCLVGGGLGALGLGIFRWQRSAARRGARGAQQGLVD